uniref:Uncharacterized protein n=1 Tax=Ascaris lumbricoides TaxID=6252 RepID=A0A0M3IMC8_ASCLU
MNQRSVVRRRSNKEPVPAAWDSSNHESFFSQTQRENSFFDRSDSPESQRSFFTLREQEEPYPIALDEKSSRSFFKSTHYDEPFSRSPIEQGSFFTQGKQEDDGFAEDSSDEAYREGVVGSATSAVDRHGRSSKKKSPADAEAAVHERRPTIDKVVGWIVSRLPGAIWNRPKKKKLVRLLWESRALGVVAHAPIRRNLELILLRSSARARAFTDRNRMLATLVANAATCLFKCDILSAVAFRANSVGIQDGVVDINQRRTV